MPLTDSKVRAAKPKPQAYKLADHDGLYLLVSTNGSKYWRLKFRFAGKEKLLALGVYPDVSLSDARTKRDIARKQLAQGKDPSILKKAEKHATLEAATNSFKVVAEEWLEKRGKKSAGGEKRLKRLLSKDLFPYVGSRPISEISAPELLSVLRRIEHRGAVNTAHRAKQAAGMVFRYGIATGRLVRDPSADLKGALKVPLRTHRAAITDPVELGKVLKAIDSYRGTPVVEAALKLTPLLFCRPGELRHLEWCEVKFAQSQIEIPGKKMKEGMPHIIPLCKQTKRLIEDLYPLTGNGKYVFPSARGSSRPLSENGVRTALRTLGFTNDQVCPHGFRATARTLLAEVHRCNPEWIELQLAHKVPDVNPGAYNRVKFLEERHVMMQQWADYLDRLKSGAEGNLPLPD